MGSGKLIKEAIKEYGIEYFTKDILEFFDNRYQAIKAEIQIVTDEFVKDEMTYNLVTGGGTSPFPMSMNIRKRMSESRKGHVVSEETRRKISETLKGQKFTEERIENIRIATKLAMTSEVIEKISEKNKGRKQTEEEIQKRVAANTGKKRSEETKKLIGERVRDAKKRKKEKENASCI